MLSYRRASLGFLVILFALTATTMVAFGGKASHKGWPKIPAGHLRFAKPGGSHLIGSSKSDELLGQHGDDTLEGSGASDVLWGDLQPNNQPLSQHDRIDGGDGKDFIYTSHGYNTVDAGDGSDEVHAHYGFGTINCGPGNDLVFVSHRSEKKYKLTGCERTTHRSSL
jgi:Ca2+-binding RTX toxin-like protein